MVLLYMITFKIYHQYTRVMLAYIPAPWIRHGVFKGMNFAELVDPVFLLGDPMNRIKSLWPHWAPGSSWVAEAISSNSYTRPGYD